MKKFILILALLIGLQQSSQAFWPFTKTKTSTVDQQRHSFDQNALDVQSTVQGERTPAPNVTITGTNNTANVNIAGNPGYKAQAHTSTAAQSNLDTHEADSSLMQTKLPMSIALILLSVGIFMLLLVIKYARAQSPAVDAAISYADSKIAEGISALEHQSSTETNTQKLSQINATRSVLEKVRGKVKSYKPKK